MGIFKRSNLAELIFGQKFVTGSLATQIFGLDLIGKKERSDPIF